MTRESVMPCTGSGFADRGRQTPYWQFVLGTFAALLVTKVLFMWHGWAPNTAALADWAASSLVMAVGFCGFEAFRRRRA